MTRRDCTLVFLLAVIAGCGDEVMTLHPIVDVPTNAGAYPLDEVNGLVLSVAESGHEGNIQLAQSSVDDPPSLSGVPFGDDMVLHLKGVRGTVPQAYGRSCSFSVPDDELGDPRIYFSLNVRWGTAPVPQVPTRTGGYAYALDSGARAVFIGGGAQVTEAEMFDARSTGAFRSLPEPDPDVPLIRARSEGVLAPFADGRAVLVGGIDGLGEYPASALLIDPTGPELQVVVGTGPQVKRPAAATLVDGSVVVAGGRTPDGVTADAWLFTATGTELVMEGLPVPLNIARADHTATLLSNEVGADVLMIGGRDEAGAVVAQAELYRPLTESFEIVDGATMLVPRWGHRAVRMPGGFVLVIGGFALDPVSMLDEPVTQLELYDPVQGQFVDAGELPPGAGLVEMSVSRLPDGRALLAGGLDETGTPVSTAHYADIDTVDGRLVVGPTDEMGFPRAGHSAVRLCDGTILVIGGTEDTAPAERYNPREIGRR